MKGRIQVRPLTFIGASQKLGYGRSYGGLRHFRDILNRKTYESLKVSTRTSNVLCNANCLLEMWWAHF